MLATAKLAGLFAAEIVLLVTPMILPTIPTWIGIGAYAVAVGLLLYAAFQVGRHMGWWRVGHRASRVPLVEVIRAAEKADWGGRQDLEWLDLLEALHQAASDGEITIYGRPMNGTTSVHLALDRPLSPIPADRWREGWEIDAFEFIRLEDNENTSTRFMANSERSARERHIDLYVEGPAPARWIKTYAWKFRGRTEEREKRRKSGVR